MSTAAALLVSAQDTLDECNTNAATHYWMGVRDALDAVFRGLQECAGVEVGDDAILEARLVLAQMDAGERGKLMACCRECLRARRAESIRGTVAAL